MKRKGIRIRPYNHNYFTGVVVSATRAGKRWVKYFSDKPAGRLAARRRAREFGEQLFRQLPWPAKVKRKYARNTTGVIGVSRVRERARSGRWFVRYVAVWPTRDGRPRKASFSVATYGESGARRRAVEARRAGLAELLRPPGE
jgi:hypothetical protein